MTKGRVSLVVELTRAFGTDGRPASRRRIRESYRVIDKFKQVDICKSNSSGKDTIPYVLIRAERFDVRVEIQ